MNTMRAFVVALGCVVLLGPAPAAADGLKILGLTPVSEHSCIAAPISLDEGEVLSGVSWLNNDSSLPFPKLLLMEGVPGEPPDLGQTGMILQEVTGEVLQWGEVALDVPVTSSTGFIYAVWVFPPNVETTGQGLGEGPGIGLEEAPSEFPFYLSADGQEWMQFSRDFRLSVQPVVAAGAARSAAPPTTLAELAGGVGYSPEAAGEGSASPLPVRTGLQAARPNPFNPRTVISYDVAHASRVSLKVYDLRGRLVRTLESRDRSPGSYRVVWVGDDDGGTSVASGVYFIRFEADGIDATRRVTLVR